MPCPRKQARRTGMAGPLGEMFDHGALTSISALPFIFLPTLFLARL